MDRAAMGASEGTELGVSDVLVTYDVVPPETVGRGTEGETPPLNSAYTWRGDGVGILTEAVGLDGTVLG
jgi:hypothetical protein